MKVNHILRLTFGLAILGLAALASAQAPDVVVPEIVTTQPEASAQPGPWWVSTDKAVGPTGLVDWSLFPPDARSRVQALLDDTESSESDDPWSRLRRPGCDAVSIAGETISVEPRPNGTISDLAEHAEWIVLADVTSWRQGFLDGTPSSLYGLRPVEILKAPDPEALDSGWPARLFLVYPYARISLERGTICRVGKRFPDHPQPGSQVLVFSYRGSNWTVDGDLYLRPDDSELFFSRPGGAVSIPERNGELLELEGLNLEFFVSKTKQALAGAGEGTS